MIGFDFIKDRARPYRETLLPMWLDFQTTRLWQKGQEVRRTFLSERKTHAFSIGLPKTGTTSIARMVNCRSAHEPETNTLLYLYDQRMDGKMSVEDQARVLKARDTLLWLELESNHLLGLVVEGLVTAFPNARFVLTVRDPESWLESQINQQFEKGHIEPFKSALQRMYANNEISHHDSKLLDYGFYGLSGYLSYWSRQNIHVLNTIPDKNLKVVWTRDITPRADEITNFLNVNGFDKVNTHRNVRKDKKIKLDSIVDRKYLSDKIRFHTEDAVRVLKDASNYPPSHRDIEIHRLEYNLNGDTIDNVY